MTRGTWPDGPRHSFSSKSSARTVSPTPASTSKRRHRLSEGELPGQDPCGRQVGVGHHLGRGQVHGGVLHQKDRGRTGDERDITQRDPYKRAQACPVGLDDRARAPESAARPRRRPATGRLKARIGSPRFSKAHQTACRRHAPRSPRKKNRLAGADLEGADRGNIGAEDHPDRARRPDGQRQRDARRHALPQQGPSRSPRSSPGSG